MSQTAVSPSHSQLLRMVTNVVAGYLKKNHVSGTELPELIGAVYLALSQQGGAAPVIQEEPPEPAVAIKRSITPDYLICLEDGKKLKMLKRHLMTAYGMTPDDYRARWGLPPDYPMVAPNYAAQRSILAKEIGLGSRGRSRTVPAAKGRKTGG
ncbi:MAG TPA: MucR family transcriptional regulator [Stellaceae bacterium]|nr:MucR family transcriptional regulator [Stellaceae bacterium]